jgi:replicative DNA helicase
VKKTKALYQDILDILIFSDTRESYEIPLPVKSKMDFLKKITEMLLSDKTAESIRDSLSLSEKYKQHQDFLELIIKEKIKDERFQDYIRQVRIRKKIGALFQNYDELNGVLDSIKDCSFDSIDDLVDDYESTIKTLYTNMMESNRAITIEAAASLDLMKDDYTSVVEMIQKKYEKSNKTPSGFKLLDSADYLNGGYEPSRLYIWGGGSGAGKSTMLNNSIYRAALSYQNLLIDEPSRRTPKKGEIHNVFIYVTMENTIEESLMRTYQPMFSKTIPQMLTDIKQKVNIGQAMMDEFAKNSSTIVMKYFPAMSISTLDLMSVVDDVMDQYGTESVAGLYVDYLDLLKTDTKYDIYRMELGHITLSLKTLAVQYNIPVITASQLARRVYSIQESRELSLDQMSESIKKVEHADFIGLLGKDQNDNSIVHGKIGKNRAGKSNIALQFNVDFSMFKFQDAIVAANKSKADACNDGHALLQFDGFGAKF